MKPKGLHINLLMRTYDGEELATIFFTPKTLDPMTLSELFVHTSLQNHFMEVDTKLEQVQARTIR